MLTQHSNRLRFRTQTLHHVPRSAAPPQPHPDVLSAALGPCLLPRLSHAFCTSAPHTGAPTESHRGAHLLSDLISSHPASTPTPVRGPAPLPLPPPLFPLWPCISPGTERKVRVDQSQLDHRRSSIQHPHPLLCSPESLGTTPSSDHSQAPLTPAALSS